MEDSAGKSVKDKYIPTDSYLKQNLGSGEYVKDIGITVAMGAGGFIIGRMFGKMSAYIGGKLGALGGIFRHWKKTEGKLENVASVLDKAKTVLDPKVLEKEVAGEAALITDMQAVEKILNKRSGLANYTEKVTAKREAADKWWERN